MKTIKDFTPEIQARIPEYIERAMIGVSDGGRYNNFDLEKAIKCVEWNYKQSGLKTPLVIVAENPLEMNLLFNYVNMLIKTSKDVSSQLSSQLYSQLSSQLHSQLHSQLSSQLDSQLDSQLHSQLRSQLHSQLHSQLSSQLHSQLHSQLSSQLYSQLRSQLHSQLHSQLSSQLDSQLDSQLHSQLDSQLDKSDSELHKYNSSYLFTMNFYSDCYYAWYEFMRNEFNLDLTVNFDFQECFKLQKESGICQAIFSEALCVVCKYPKKINWNINSNMHSTEGVSVEWSSTSDLTSFECYYINGRNIDKSTHEKIKSKTLTVEEFFKIDNEEHKSTAIAMMQELYGDSYLADFLKESLTKIDTYIDKKEDKYLEGTSGGMNVGVYTLFKGEVEGFDISYVRCYCPSTDRMFFLGVENEYDNAKDAIASLYRVPRKLVGNIEYIQRQGERFSTVFDSEGQEMVKVMSKKDVQDTVVVSGNDYFRYLKYEF